MNDLITLVLLIGLAYLIGSIPFAIVMSKVFGLQDPRSFGSGNPGATNVLRSGNKKAAALTLIGDALKGWFAIFFAQLILPTISEWGIAAVGLAVFLGHIYSVFLKFKGGKGVATGIGVLFALQAYLAAVILAIWLLVAVMFRYSSLAAIVAAALAPAIYALASMNAWVFRGPYFILIVTISCLLVYKHKNNITALMLGTESRIGKKKH